MSLEQAEEAASAILKDWGERGLRAVVITFALGHLLRERPGPSWMSKQGAIEPNSANATCPMMQEIMWLSDDQRGPLDQKSRFGDTASRHVPYDTLIVPRQLVKAVDTIGAADAFIGGFLAASMLGLSSARSLLWAHTAGNLSLSKRGAQEVRSASTWSLGAERAAGTSPSRRTDEPLRGPSHPPAS